MFEKINRRDFLQKSTFATAGILLLPDLIVCKSKSIVMTVLGPIDANAVGFTLTHEHILVDFIGADKINKARYDAEEVFRIALPFLKELKMKGCDTLIECTPAYLGRDPQLLKRLSVASGLNMVSNTGYYGAVNEKYLPAHARTESAEQLAARWISESKKGIEGTGIKPGFIKTSVDKAPLTPTQRKIISAAALTHLATGLVIAIHTGNGEAAKEQLAILNSYGVRPDARIWVHAQNEQDITYHIEAAKHDSWVSFDGVNPESIRTYVNFLQTMKKENLLHRVLVSQDSGWYHVGEVKGGTFNSFTCIFTEFIPALQREGFTREEIDLIFRKNPAATFTIAVRK
jgi:predicted metal-dependent phosphotriesterase family hydrolase